MRGRPVHRGYRLTEQGRRRYQFRVCLGVQTADEWMTRTGTVMTGDVLEGRDGDAAALTPGAFMIDVLSEITPKRSTQFRVRLLTPAGWDDHTFHLQAGDGLELNVPHIRPYLRLDILAIEPVPFPERWEPLFS